jgi:hypothetical protein
MTTRKSSKFTQFALVVVFVVSVLSSVSQLKVSADYCAGFPCYTGSDCAGSCFCNGRTGTCE